MIPKTPRAILLTVVIAAIAAAPASAQNIPPGNSGADQYTENVPGAGGDQPSGGAPDDGGASGPISPDTAAALESLGAEGAQAAAVLDATAPQSKQLKKAVNAGGGEASGGTTPQTDSGGGASLASAVGDAVSGSDTGMGPVLPILLLLILVGALGLALRRRLGTGGTHAQG